MDERWLQSLVVGRKSEESKDGVSSRESDAKEGDDEDGVQKKAIFEIPVEIEGDGSFKFKDAETTIQYTIPPSRVNGKWSGLVEGRSVPRGRSLASFKLEYKATELGKVSVGMVHGQQAMHPLLSIGGSMQVKGSAVGLSFYRHQPFGSNRPSSTGVSYDLSWRHKLANSKWIIQSQLSRTQIVSISAKKSKVEGAIRWNLRKPKFLTLRLDLKPRISDFRSAHLYGQCGIVGFWQVGCTIIQSLHSQMATVGMGLRIKSSRGIEWMFSWNRGDACIRIPVLISKTLNATSLGQAVYMSLFSFVLEEAIADMWGWHDKAQTDAAQRAISMTEKSQHAGKAQRDAELQMELMKRQATRKNKQEEKVNGLIIEKAVYGVKNGKSLDVTVQLQFWILNSTVTLPATSKKDLLGFYDVRNLDDESASSTLNYPSSPKTAPWWQNLWADEEDLQKGHTDSGQPIPTLTIRYKYRGKTMQVTIKDDDPLTLPYSISKPSTNKVG